MNGREWRETCPACGGRGSVSDDGSGAAGDKLLCPFCDRPMKRGQVHPVVGQTWHCAHQDCFGRSLANAAKKGLKP